MKKSLFLLSMLTAIWSNAQNKLVAVTNLSYDTTGQIEYADSTSYSYTSSQGSFSELKPKFMFVGDAYVYALDEFFVHCSSSNNYSGSVYPLNLNSTTTNTLTNGWVTESSESPMSRTLYTYNTANQQTSEVSQIFSSPDWTTVDSASNTYSTLGYLTSTAQYSFGGSGLELVNTDTTWYLGGTDKITKYIAYQIDFSSGIFYPTSKSIITYSGSNIDYVDMYSGFGTLQWDYRVDYNYSGANCVGFVAYEVISDVVTTGIFAEGTFTFTSSNQPFEYLLSFYGEPELKMEYEYYPDGFIKSEKTSESDISVGYNVLYSTNYYYQSTAGTQSILDATVAIFPNPAKNVVTISTTSELKEVQVLNLNGQVVLKQNTKTIDMSHLPSGMYIINGVTENGAFSEKIIKE